MPRFKCILKGNAPGFKFKGILLTPHPQYLKSWYILIHCIFGSWLSYTSFYFLGVSNCFSLFFSRGKAYDF
jgi:hypothetical protein